MNKIGFCATVSCGKSTLVKELAKLPEFKDYYISTERSKYLKELGIPINTQTNILGQFVFMSERASELINEKLITDRTIWDVDSFTLVTNLIDWGAKEDLIKASRHMMDEYDIVFYISPEGMPIEDNNIRATDPKYRNNIDIAIRELLQEYPPKQLVEIKGMTVEERVEFVLSYIFPKQS